MFDKFKNTSTTDRVMESKATEPVLSVPNAGAAQPVAGKASVIAAGIKVTGEISGTESILVEGRVDGRINLAGNDVTVGRTGQVKADVTAKSIRVAGEVNGDLTARERVVISGTGNVHGNVVAPRVVLEDGAIFKGSIDMDPGDGAVKELAASRSAGKANGVTANAVDAAGGPASIAGNAAAAEAGNKAPDLALKGR